MNQESNFFDELNPVNTDESLKFQQQAEAKGKKIDYLIHKVFAQTEEGRELLEIWKEALIMVPVPREEMELKEGMNRFIRGILLTVKRVEEGN